MAVSYPGATNTYVLSHEASNKLVVDYSRNVKDFAVNKYAQLVPVDKMTGYYLNMTVEEAGRILNSDLRDFNWPDNSVAPEGHNGNESFEYLPYRAKRLVFPFNIGKLTADQASWEIVAQHSRIHSQKAMTARTQAAYNALSDTSKYLAGHNLDVTAISGASGRWDQSTTGRSDIMRSINAAVEQILDSTLAAVSPDDLQLVISSGLAAKLRQSQEIVDYIKQSPDALAALRGELPNDNKVHGLPAKLYGVPIVVEKTRKVTSIKKAATRAVSPVFPVSEAYLVSRPGGLEGVADAPSFSSLSVMMQEEMTVEVKDDIDNRRTNGRVVENYDTVLTAPAATVRFHTVAA